MSNSNKTIREALEKEYGHKCMYHEGIRTLRPPRVSNQVYKGKKLQDQLTLHHLVPVNRYKARGIHGETTKENGAILCRYCHDYIEQLPDEEREKINDELREYKAKAFNFEIGAIEFDTGGIRQAKKIQFKSTDDVIVIPAYDNELQQKIFEDNLDEIRWER